MNKMKLYIDFDDTIVNSTKRLVEMLGDYYYHKENWRKLKRYDATDLYPECTDKVVEDMFARPDFFCGLVIKKGFNFAMNILSKFCDINIVTLGTTKNLKHKFDWCNRVFDFKFTFIGKSDFTIAKTEVDMSHGIMVDDKTDVLMGTNAKYKILIRGHRDVEWNQVEDGTDIIVVNNWLGILFKILKIIRMERKSN